MKGKILPLMVYTDFTLDENGYLKFKLNNWLSGLEYGFLLRHYRAYVESYPDQVLFSEKNHPPAVYENPRGKLI